MYVRRFQEKDIPAILSMIHNTLQTVNNKDYPPAMIQTLVEMFTINKIKQIADNSHMYVVTDKIIIGCGAIGLLNENEAFIQAVFVSFDYINKGVGKLIMKSLETDEYGSKSRRIELLSSLSANLFYERLGYTYKDNLKIYDENLLYCMEKYL